MVTLDSALIPQEVQAEVIQGVVQASVALSLAQTQPMPTGSQAIPVLGSLPTAGWVGAPGGRKPTTQMNWTAQILKAEEVAATIDVPIAYLDDAGFPLWDNIQPRMVESLAKVVDEALLFGVGAPASFPVGGVMAFSTAVALPAAPEADIAGLFNAALATVEAQGLAPTGHAADITARALVRGARDTVGQPLFNPPTVDSPGTVYGYPVSWSTGAAFDTTQAIDFTGDWTCLRVGIRQDVTIDQSDEAVLADSTGKVLVSAFQDDKRIMRVHMRLGAVIGKPVTAKAPSGAVPWAHIPPGLVTSTAAVLAATPSEDAAPSKSGNGGTK